MKWDRDYVRSKYGFSYLGQECIFYPSVNCKRLIVIFSSMGKDRFDRYSWFWDENEVWNECAYLFIKDDSFQYFLGDDNKPLTHTFIKIIMNTIEKCKLSAIDTFTVGASMGGYAAIYYASLLNLGGAVVANPQVNYASSRKHSFENWERQIRSVGNQWYDLEDFICKKHVPNIYIEYGKYPADESAALSLLDSIRYLKHNIIINRQDWNTHSVDGLFKETIEAAIDFFSIRNALISKYNALGK